MPALIPIVELGVAEAFEHLVERFGVRDLPPLDAIENEDWGRDLLLARLAELSDETLTGAGLTRVDAFSEISEESQSPS